MQTVARILINTTELMAWLDENPEYQSRVIPTVLRRDGTYVNASDHAEELAHGLTVAIELLKINCEFSYTVLMLESILESYREAVK